MLILLSPAKTMDFRPLTKLIEELVEGVVARCCTKKTAAGRDNRAVDAPPSRRYSVLEGNDTTGMTMKNKTKAIADTMRGFDRRGLGKALGGLSSNLTETAYEYWQNFRQTYDSGDDDDGGGGDQEDKPCVFAFTGPAYQGLDVLTASDGELEYLHRHLRILDAAYGVLRPLDQIRPYRLEMATKLNIVAARGSSNGGDDSGGKKINQKRSNSSAAKTAIKLSDYWRDVVTQALKADLLLDLGESEDGRQSQPPTHQAAPPSLVVNLASDEYSSAVDVDELLDVSDRSNNDGGNDERNTTRLVNWVKVIFQEQGRVVSVHAKRARGLMARYLAKIGASTLDDVKSFREEGYALVEENEKSNSNNSGDESRIVVLVFNRPKNWKEVAAGGRSSTGDSNNNNKKRMQSSSTNASSATAKTKTSKSGGGSSESRADAGSSGRTASKRSKR